MSTTATVLMCIAFYIICAIVHVAYVTNNNVATKWMERFLWFTTTLILGSIIPHPAQEKEFNEKVEQLQNEKHELTKRIEVQEDLIYAQKDIIDELYNCDHE